MNILYVFALFVHLEIITFYKHYMSCYMYALQKHERKRKDKHFPKTLHVKLKTEQYDSKPTTGSYIKSYGEVS